MKVKYFEDTDTLYLKLSNSNIEETKQASENLHVDLDSKGRLVSVTIEHAKASYVKPDFWNLWFLKLALHTFIKKKNP